MRQTERDIPDLRRGISAAGQKDEAGEVGLVSCWGRPQDPFESFAARRALSAFRRARAYWACLITEMQQSGPLHMFSIARLVVLPTQLIVKSVV